MAPASQTVGRPSNLSAAEAAGLLTSAVIAFQALKKAGIKFEDGTDAPSNIMITAASGGVGHHAVQLAKLTSVHVTATCGARNVDFVKSLGADEVLDYKTPDGTSLTSPSGKKYDAVIHCTTGVAWSTFEPNLSSEGQIIDISPSFRAMATSLYKRVTMSRKKLVTLVLEPKLEDIQYVVGLSGEGKLKTFVDSRHSLDKAEDAWAKSMSGHATGKVIVEM